MPSGVYKRTPEMNAANSKSKKGVKRSPETCAAISAGTLGIPKSPEHVVLRYQKGTQVFRFHLNIARH
jgi:hypothetical protein